MQAAKPQTRVLAIYDQQGPSYHRIYVPYRAIEGIYCLFTNVITEEMLENGNFDVVVFNRLFPANKLSQVLKWRDKYGFKLICDMDDHWDLDATHILSEYYEEKKLSSYILQSVIVADAVTVTHERLGEACLPYNRNVWVLPNAINPKEPQFNIDHTEGQRVRLFWAGGITHEPDLAILRNPMRRVYSDGMLRQLVMCVMGGFMQDYPEWHRMANYFTNGLQLKGALLDGRPVQEYYQLYKYADICLIPLKESRFNSYKSNLKILEAANMGLPVVVSNVHPYKDFPPELVNYVNSQTDWYKYIRHLVADPSYRIQQGAALKEYCANVFNFEGINQERIKLLNSLVEVEP